MDERTLSRARNASLWEWAREAVRNLPPINYVSEGPPEFVKGLQNVYLVSKLAMYGQERKEEDLDYLYLVWKDREGKTRARKVISYKFSDNRWIHFSAVMEGDEVKVVTHKGNKLFGTFTIPLKELNLLLQN